MHLKDKVPVVDTSCSWDATQGHVYPGDARRLRNPIISTTVNINENVS